MSVAEALNRLPEGEARDELLHCCGSIRWVERMLSLRPFEGDAALLESADREWWTLDRGDWMEAFAAHPRIGARSLEGRSRREQSGIGTASEETRRALADWNEVYERRFGHVFLIFASGLTGEEMLAELRARIQNEPGEELRIAARQHAEITRSRLQGLANR